MKKTCGIVYLNKFYNKILLVKNKNWLTEKFIWSLPKGTFEKCKDKSVEDCALREFSEETNLILHKNSKRNLKLSTKLNNVQLYIFIYVENNLNYISTRNQINRNEICDIRWISINNLKNLKNSNYSIKFIKKHIYSIVNKLKNSQNNYRHGSYKITYNK